MKKYILLSLVMIPQLIGANNIRLETIELESIEVNAQEEQKTVNTTGFVGDVVFQKEGYMNAVPMQKQISGQRAIEVAGSNGDPLKALQTFAGISSTNNDIGSQIYIHGSKPRETSIRGQVTTTI